MKYGQQVWFVYVEQAMDCKRITIGFGGCFDEADGCYLIGSFGRFISVEKKYVKTSKREAYQIAAQILAADIFMDDLSQHAEMF